MALYRTKYLVGDPKLLIFKITSISKKWEERGKVWLSGYSIKEVYKKSFSDELCQIDPTIEFKVLMHKKLLGLYLRYVEIFDHSTLKSFSALELLIGIRKYIIKSADLEKIA